jgi:hypothetical protein
MTQGLAAGPFGSPGRAAPGAAEASFAPGRGAFERSIAIVRTIVSYVAVARSWLPLEVGR